MRGAGALGRLRGMVRGGRRETSEEAGAGVHRKDDGRGTKVEVELETMDEFIRIYRRWF